MTKKLGFTLAEVLITLGIIGVIAALTIPTLMNQTGQAEYKTALKKAVSALNQAVRMSVALEDFDFSDFDNDIETQKPYSMFTSRMKVVDTAPENFSLYDGFGGGSQYTLILNDGIAIAYEAGAEHCTSSSKCQLFVDVNGPKGPNIISTATDTTGRITDQFVLEMYDQTVGAGNEATQYALYR